MADLGVRYDKAPIKVGATPIEVRANGAKVYEGTAAFGDIVKRYPDLDPPRNEFIPADEMASPAALASLRGAIFTGGPRAKDWDGRVTLPADHPSDLSNPDTAADLLEGVVLDGWRVDPPDDYPMLKVRVIAHTRPMQDLIESGTHELSLGMRAAEDWTEGVGPRCGTPYQCVQRSIVYDHLNAVGRARSRTPDGRAARLDAEAATKPSYPRPGENMLNPEVLALLAKHVMKMDALSAEDAALLAQMSPEAQAALRAAAEGIGAAAAEGATIKTKTNNTTDIAAVMSELAALKADVAALKAIKTDAPAPPAVDPKKMDGTTPTVTPRQDSAAMLTDPAAVIAAAQKAATAASVQAYNNAAQFVGHVRKDGHAANTTDDAATVMLTVIKEHLPILAPTAAEHVKGQRLDALLPIYDQAENLRRAALLRQQGEDVSSIVHRNDAAPADSNTLEMFRAPSRPARVR